MKGMGVVAVGGMLAVALLAGCSSGPSKDELTQLSTAQAELQSLGRKADELRSEKAKWQQSVNEKQAKLKACQNDQAAVAAKKSN